MERALVAHSYFEELMNMRAIMTQAQLQQTQVAYYLERGESGASVLLKMELLLYHSIVLD
jgi:predicted XRE-type DNA-binding protein